MTAAAIVLIVITGIYGLVIGSFLNVVAYRVPAGVPLTRESRCPSCDAKIRWWQNVPVLGWLALRGRCAFCGAAISARYPAVEALTGILFAAVAAGVAFSRPLDARPVDGRLWLGSAEFWGILVTMLVFLSISIALTLIDLDTTRLPNAIVLPGWVTMIVLLLVTTVLIGLLPAEGGLEAGTTTDAGTWAGIDWGPFVRAVVGGVALFVFYFIVRLISPRGMGGGDVKLAGLAGTMMAWFGWGPFIVGAFAAFALGGLFGIAMMLIGRARRKTAIPFGPWMLAGAWTGIIVGEPVSRWYLGLLS